MRARLLKIMGAVALCGASSVAYAGSPPLFVHQDGIFGAQPCNGGGCYTRYLRVADLDGDGDLDIAFPNGSGSQPLVIYENDGAGAFTDISAAAVGGYSANVHQMGIGDIDGDGDLDLYVPVNGGGNGALFINDGSGVFSDEAADRLPAQPFGVGSTRMGDLDDDGDLDLLIADTGSSGEVVVYLNDGDGSFEALADAFPFDAGDDLNDIDLFDVDRDFDLDLMTNAHFGANRIWINDGTGTFSDSDFSSSGGLHYGPGICDVDGDGDLDVWIDNQGPDYTERLWVNDGSGSFTDVTVAQVSGNPGSDDNGIVCADADNDGDMDAVVVSLGTPERLLVNDGSGMFTYLPGAFEGPTDSSLWAEMGDLNGDDRLDIVTGQGESGSFLNRVHFASNAVQADTTAPRIIVTEVAPAEAVEAGAFAVTHFAVSDGAVSDMGPRLERAYADVDPDGAAITVEASFMGGDLFRVELPGAGVSGTVLYRLCAEDPAGNVGCSDDMEYEAAQDPGGSSSGGETGDPTGVDTESESGAPGTTSGDPSGGTTGEDPTSPQTSGGPGETGGVSGGTGTDGDTEGAGADGSGGGCRTGGPSGAGWLWVLAVAGVLRRRRVGC